MFARGDILSKPSTENPEITDLDMHCPMGETDGSTKHHRRVCVLGWRRQSAGVEVCGSREAEAGEERRSD